MCRSALEADAEKIITEWNKQHHLETSDPLFVRRLRRALNRDAELVAKVLMILHTTCNECWDRDVSGRTCYCSFDD